MNKNITEKIEQAQKLLAEISLLISAKEMGYVLQSNFNTTADVTSDIDSGDVCPTSRHNGQDSDAI